MKHFPSRASLKGEESCGEELRNYLKRRRIASMFAFRDRSFLSGIRASLITHNNYCEFRCLP